MDDIFSALRDKGCTITPSDRSYKPSYDVTRAGNLLLKTGTYKKGGPFFEVPLREIKGQKPFTNIANSKWLEEQLQFISKYERTETRKRNSPSCYLSELTELEKHKLIKITVNIGKALEQKDIKYLRESSIDSLDEQQETVSVGQGYSSLKLIVEDNSDVGIEIYPEEIESTEVTYSEGAARKILVNAYERDKRARSACLEYYGHACQVCKMDFWSRYGTIGIGFIHVHHIKPISQIGEKYEVDPIEDLIPVCPNCHAMLHKSNPPYSVEDLRSMLK